MTRSLVVMPARRNKELRLAISVLLALSAGEAFAALCNGGATVSSALTVSASCDGANVKGLTLDTGAAVTIDSGVTVSNDAPFGVNGRAVVVLSTATSSSLVNNGSIYTNNQWGLWVQSGGHVSVVNNSQITGVVRYGISNQGTIDSLTNVGTITGGFGSIGNVSSTITVFNNLQGAQSSNPVTLAGNLPVNYNIIINSTSQYGQLSASGAAGNMAFNIYGNTGTTLVPGVSASVVTAGRYQKVLQNFTTLSNVSGTTGSYAGYDYSLIANGTTANSWDLLFVLASSPAVPAGPSASDTQAAIRSLAPGLRSGFNRQAIATNFANMNTYDCNLFDTRGFCVSVGGQRTRVDNPGATTTSAVLVVGYRISPTLRIGGFLNRDVWNNTVPSVRVSNSNPLMGLFGVWNQNENHSGYQVKIANAYQNKDLTTTREVVGTSEAGTGSTTLRNRSYVGELSYAILANKEKTLVRPYAALRYTKISQDAYTENSSVTAPLTFAALQDRSTTALVGVKLHHKLTDQVGLTGSIGIEHDISHHVDNLAATGVSGLTSENFNDSIKRTRPVASAGAYYSPARNHRLAVEIYYQQLPFQSTGSATAYMHYTIGF
jgi:hypothetical protein